jgi:hypothetical protein
VHLDIDVLGTRVVVDAPPASPAATRLPELWAAFPRAVAGRSVLLALDATGVRRDGVPLIDADGEFAVNVVSAEINRAAVDGVSDLAVHAGCVALGGRVIAWPAESGQGKSTLTAAAVLAGAAYVSDEALCLQESAAVRAYPKPIALAPWTLQHLGLPGTAENAEERLIAPAELGAVATGRLELTDVLVLRRAPEGTRPDLVRLPGTAIVPLLLEKSFNHYLRPADSLRLVADCARRARAWQLTYSSPVDAAGLLLDELG